jgi:hypothetical protein
MDAPAWSARSSLASCASISGKIRNAMREVEEFNTKLTLAITRSVGAIACASIQPTQACRPLIGRIVGGGARIS